MTINDDLESLSNVSLDMNLVKTNIPQYDDQKLCDMIVCDRYFGFNQEIAVMCMEELAKRRMAGSTFAFEDYIEEAFKELPKLEFGLPDLRTVLHQAIGNKINRK